MWEAVISIWDFAIDFGLISALILAAKYIRTSVELVQRLYIPVAMIAGLMGLLLGTNGLGVLPLSAASSGYGSILIAVIFAAIGLTTHFPAASVLFRRTGKLFAFNQIVTISQWFFAIILGLYFLTLFDPDIPNTFGLIMPAGFMGGHGTAAAVGNTLIDLGWDAALSMALTSATVGVFAAVIGGITIINIGAYLGLINNVTKFKDLELHFRKGLVPQAERNSVGEETVSSSSVNVFTLHVSLIGIVVLSAYFTAKYLSSFNEFVSIPVFACAFLYGCLLRTILKRTKALEHFDDRLLSFSAGAATDYLVVFGIASIKITVVLSYALPFLVLMLCGLGLCAFLVFVVAPRLLGEYWFEKAVFSWGWMTGTVAMGMLLLRIADPKGRAKILEDYAIAYIPGSIVDIILVALLPSLVMTGHAFSALAVMLVYLVLVVGLSLFLNAKGSIK